MSGVNTITGVDAYGWNCAGDAYLDNFVIEYVEEPVFEPIIWEEDFSGDVSGYTFKDGATVENEAFRTTTGNGLGGFELNTLSAAVADAPMGQMHFKFDINVNGQAASKWKVDLLSDAGSIYLIDFGQYNILRPSNDQNASYNNTFFDGGEWYTTDIVLDFDNNKLIINVAETESGNAILTDYEYTYDLSGVNTITGVDAYGWNCASDAYLDNFVLEYVTEEGPDEPITPPEDEFNPIIWEEDFSSDVSGYTFKDDATVENEVFRTTKGNGLGGFELNTLSAAVADAPMGQMHFKFDINVNGQAASKWKVDLLSDAGSIYLIDFGQYNILRPSNDQNASYNNTFFDGGEWYTTDIVLDFDNNKLIINVAETESGNAILTDYEYTYDLSGVNTITGVDAYGWNCASDAYLDNFVLEYVTEEGPDEPITPPEDEFNPIIWEEDFSSDVSGYTFKDDATVENEVFRTTKGNGLGGFELNTLSAAVADAPMGQMHFKFDINVNGQAASKWKVDLLSDAGSIYLIDFGQYNILRPSNDQNASYNNTFFDGGEWYTTDIVLDFDNNKLIINVAETESGNAILTDFEYAYDLSGVNTITGVDAYGWACVEDAYLDNFVLEYVVGEFDVNADSISIWTNDYEEYIANVAPGANKIVIDFGTAVKESSLEGAVTLTNVTDANANVEFEGTLSGSKYTMTFDGLLANKTYKLAISGNIENVLGETIGHDYDLSFTTTNGDFKASLVSLKQGSTVIDDLADITAGDATVTVSFEKTNPGEKTIKVLYAFYNGNKMETIVVHDIVIGEEEISGTKTDTVTFGTLDGITNVKVMLWEDLVDINPLSAEINL